MLKGISFSDEVMASVQRALRESHRDERKFREDAIARLRREHQRLQDRIDAMYLDKLDGRIDTASSTGKASEFRGEQARIMREIEAHQAADRNYAQDGLRLLELAQGAHAQFENQPPAKKRHLLNFVLSNCTWKDGKLTAQYRQPFASLALAVAADRKTNAGGGSQAGNFDNWRGVVDTFGTLGVSGVLSGVDWNSPKLMMEKDFLAKRNSGV